jgi:hypothetical protein
MGKGRTNLDFFLHIVDIFPTFEYFGNVQAE